MQPPSHCSSSLCSHASHHRATLPIIYSPFFSFFLLHALTIVVYEQSKGMTTTQANKHHLHHIFYIIFIFIFILQNMQVALHSLNPPDEEGYLVKKGGDFKTWKKRYIPHQELQFNI